jgi:hypothetical protein
MKNMFRKLRTTNIDVDSTKNLPAIRSLQISAMVDIAIETWRLHDRLKKLQVAAGREDPSIAFSVDKIQHILKEIGIETRDHTGEAYTEGMSLDVLARDYPTSEKPLRRIVQETISPAIYLDGKLEKMAQVIVGKVGDQTDGTKHD